MTGCLGCLDPHDDVDAIAVGDVLKVVLHPDQTLPGSCLVVPRRHVGELRLLIDDEWSALRAALVAIDEVLRSRLGAANLNTLQMGDWAFRADDPVPPWVDGSPSPHLHWHVLPRYSGPVVVGGETFADVDFGGPVTWGGRMAGAAARAELFGVLGAAVLS
jgi:diadenosine tetraphosphate (Ap4A) HIT family hydrolase